MSESIIAVEKLKNGLEVTFHDHGNRYFGDYHQVKVTVVCRIELLDALQSECLSAEELEKARQLFGDHIKYERILKQMGVAGSEVEQVKSGLVSNFVNNAMSYMQADDFAARFVARRLAEHRNRSRLRLVSHD